MRSSLRTTFVALWLLVVAASVALAFLLYGLYRLGVDARVDAVAARVDKAATALTTRFGLYARSYPSAPDFTDAERRRELGLMLQIVLQDYDDVEGGFYAPQAGFLAYAYPSYEGSGTKQDVPEAESARIAAVAERAASGGGKAVDRVAGARQTLIVEAVPAGVAGQRLSIWVMSRAHVRADDGARRLFVGLALLGLFIVGSGVALLVTMRRWNGAVARLGEDIGRAPSGAAWEVAPTGHRDLDRVAGMATALHRRLDDERRNALRLGDELARAQRVATVGRMTAQLVHEIRNPLAAMRLRAENALAGTADRDAALAAVLADVERLDELLERLQAMTRLTALKREPTALAAFVATHVDAQRPLADARRVTLVVDPAAAATRWPLDAAQLGRAVDNLLSNAVRHAPDDGSGRVVVRVAVDAAPNDSGGAGDADAAAAARCRFAVEDNGPGIADDDAERVFEPFHTTRSDGSGLGLSIAREIVEAHGGTLAVVPRSARPAGAAGALFVIELPWRTS